MNTDNRTNEPTDEQILAALNAYSSKGLEIDGYDPVDEYPSLDMWGERFASQMRAALVAAQGAAPQAESEPRSSYISPHLPAQIRGLYRADLREKSIQTMLDLAGDLVQELIDLKAAPVLPSSGVDEDAREFRFTDAQWREYQSIPEQGYSHRHHLEHVFNAWLKEQGL